MPRPIKSKNGVWTLSVGHNRVRRKLTLGKIETAKARLFAANIERLQSHVKLKPGTVPTEIESWLSNVSSQHRKQLGELGLISIYNPAMTVGELVNSFLDHYDTTSNDPNTKTQMRSALENRVHPKLSQIKVSDLEPVKPPDRPNAEPVFSDEAIRHLNQFQSWQREFYAKSTWSKDNGRLREMGRWAVRCGIIDHSPFVLLPKPGEVNSERNFYVHPDIVRDAMDYTLDPDTRITLAMGRFAGLRTPSEIRSLKWSYCDFEKHQLQIMDSKKKKLRTMPMFDEIAAELIRHREATAAEKSRFVLSSRARSTTDANNYNLIKEAIARAGHDLWPRLRQNLRASCENDFLNAGFKERKVTLWIGHTVKVSRAHYQNQTDAEVLRDVERMRTS